MTFTYCKKYTHPLKTHTSAGTHTYTHTLEIGILQILFSVLLHPLSEKMTLFILSCKTYKNYPVSSDTIVDGPSTVSNRKKLSVSWFLIASYRPVLSLITSLLPRRVYSAISNETNQQHCFKCYTNSKT